MLKRFFVAVILGFLVVSSKISSAADIDWNSAPRIGTKADLARYIESERRKGHTTFHVILTYFKFSDDRELADRERAIFEKELINSIAIAPGSLSIVMGTGKLVYTIREYPGTRVANAYLSGDTSYLSLEEQELYRIAVGIVNEANKCSSAVEKAQYIYNFIRERVLDYKDETERNKTAIGALIDRYAQCQGYSDAFYMLGRMSGLNVRRIGGEADGIGHAWNIITFYNGKTYCIDVTCGLFKATYEDMKNNYKCDWEIIPNLQ